jgi:hypothetical protein
VAIMPLTIRSRVCMYALFAFHQLRVAATTRTLENTHSTSGRAIFQPQPPRTARLLLYPRWTPALAG